MIITDENKYIVGKNTIDHSTLVQLDNYIVGTNNLDTTLISYNHIK